MEMLEADRLQGGFNSVVYSTFKCFLSIILYICLPLQVKKILLEAPRATCIFVNTLRALLRVRVLVPPPMNKKN